MFDIDEDIPYGLKWGTHNDEVTREGLTCLSRPKRILRYPIAIARSLKRTQYTSEYEADHVLWTDTNFWQPDYTNAWHTSRIIT